MTELQTPPSGTDEEDKVIPEGDPVPVAPTLEPEPQPTPEPQPQAIEPEPLPAAPPQDYETKFRHSSSEALILNSKNKNLESTLTKLTSEDTPTDAEIIAEYSTFPQMDATSQKFVKDLLATKKRQARQDLKLAQADADRLWENELKGITRKPEYAQLRGDEEFERFVFQPKYKGVDIQTLADAHLIRSGKAQPATAPAPPAPPSSPGLPRGSGGPRGTPKTAKLSIEQATILRNTNWKEYTRMLKANLIESEV